MSLFSPGLSESISIMVFKVVWVLMDRDVPLGECGRFQTSGCRARLSKSTSEEGGGGFAGVNVLLSASIMVLEKGVGSHYTEHLYLSLSEARGVMHGANLLSERRVSIRDGARRPGHSSCSETVTNHR